MRQGELRWRDDISLGKALGQTDADSRASGIRCNDWQPATRKAPAFAASTALPGKSVDGREGIHLVRVVKHSHAGKGFWLAANSELRHEKEGRARRNASEAAHSTKELPKITAPLPLR